MSHIEQLTRAVGLLKRLTYKPNMTMSVSPVEDAYIDFMFEYRVRSIETPTVYITVESHFATPCHQMARMSDTAIVDMLYLKIQQIEIHECKEWFKFDGTPFHNPHPECCSECKGLFVHKAGCKYVGQRELRS